MHLIGAAVSGISRFCMWNRKVVSCALVVCLSTVLSLAQDTHDITSPKHRAWDILLTASLSDRASERIDGVRALGLLRDNTEARQLAEYALRNHNAEVRRAAATTLGQMHARSLTLTRRSDAANDTYVRARTVFLSKPPLMSTNWIGSGGTSTFRNWRTCSKAGARLC